MGVSLDEGPSPPTHARTLRLGQQTHTLKHTLRVCPSASTDHIVAWQHTMDHDDKVSIDLQSSGRTRSVMSM